MAPIEIDPHEDPKEYMRQFLLANPDWGQGLGAYPSSHDHQMARTFILWNAGLEAGRLGLADLKGGDALVGVLEAMKELGKIDRQNRG